MDRERDDVPTIPREIFSAVIEALASISGAVALYYVTHPTEYRLTKQRIAIRGKRCAKKCKNACIELTLWFDRADRKLTDWFNAQKLGE